MTQTLVKKMSSSNMISLNAKKFASLAATLALVTSVEAEESKLIGEWLCLQDSQISESLKGENKYTLVYEESPSLAKQYGVVTIIDAVNSLKSELKYSLEFEYSKNGRKHRSKLRTLDYTIVSDQLKLLVNGVSNFFPAEGEVVTSETEIIDDNVLRTAYADGTEIDCTKGK